MSWIGEGDYPPLFSDLTSLDYSLWFYLKDMVYFMKNSVSKNILYWMRNEEPTRKKDFYLGAVINIVCSQICEKIANENKTNMRWIF